MIEIIKYILLIFVVLLGSLGLLFAIYTGRTLEEQNKELNELYNGDVE